MNVSSDIRPDTSVMGGKSNSFFENLNYTFIFSQHNHVLLACEIEACKECKGDGTCKICEEGHFLDDGICLPDCITNDANCAACSWSNEEKCEQCVEEHMYMDKQGICKG